MLQSNFHNFINSPEPLGLHPSVVPGPYQETYGWFLGSKTTKDRFALPKRPQNLSVLGFGVRPSGETFPQFPLPHFEEVF